MRKLALLLALGSSCLAAPFTAPPLPKTAPAKSIVVLDLWDELEYGPPGASCTQEQYILSKGAYLADTVIQGLVNRGGAEKIYFTNSPNEHVYHPWPSDKQMLDDGLVPVPRTSPKLEAKLYPVLSYLVGRYMARDKRVRVVQVPEFADNGVPDGVFTSAVTACSFENAIPVTPLIEQYLRDEGYELVPVATTRPFTSNAQAFDWSFEHYFRPETNRRVIGHHGDHQKAGGHAAVSSTSSGGGLKPG